MYPWTTTTTDGSRRSTLGAGPAPVPGPSGYHRAIAAGGLCVYFFYTLYACSNVTSYLCDNTNPYQRQTRTLKCDVKSFHHVRFKHLDISRSAKNFVRSNAYLITVKSLSWYFHTI